MCCAGFALNILDLLSGHYLDSIDWDFQGWLNDLKG